MKSHLTLGHLTLGLVTALGVLAATGCSKEDSSAADPQPSAEAAASTDTEALTANYTDPTGVAENDY